MEQSPALPPLPDLPPAASSQPTQPIATEAKRNKAPLIILVLVLVVIFISISLGIVLAMRARVAPQGTVPRVQERVTPTATPTYENPFEATPTQVVNPFEQPANPFEGL